MCEEYGLIRSRECQKTNNCSKQDTRGHTHSRTRTVSSLSCCCCDLFRWHRVCVEAQSRHVVLNTGTIVIFLSIAPTGSQFGGFLLAPKNWYGIAAPVRTFLPVEHRATVFVVVLQGFGTQCVCFTDPLCDSTRHDTFVSCSYRDLMSTDFHPTFWIMAKVIATLALKEKRNICYFSSYKQILYLWHKQMSKILLCIC